MNRFKNIAAIVVLMALIVSVASSCKKNKDAKFIVTVLKDSVNFVTQDTVEVEVALANVRVYLDQIGAEHIDTTIRTGTNGKAEFIWPYPAILQYDISYASYLSEENFVILEQGETVEKTVNLDDL